MKKNLPMINDLCRKQGMSPTLIYTKGRNWIWRGDDLCGSVGVIYLAGAIHHEGQVPGAKEIVVYMYGH